MKKLTAYSVRDFTGKGTYTFPYGDKYTGEFEAGRRHGWGTQIASGMGIGIYMLAKGTKYVGEWEGDVKEGQGTMTWPDGTKYVGSFSCGLWKGEGTVTYSNGRVKTRIWGGYVWEIEKYSKSVFASIRESITGEEEMEPPEILEDVGKDGTHKTEK